MQLLATTATTSQIPLNSGEGSVALESSDSSRSGQLSIEEQRQLHRLQARDSEVRAHEQAHMRVGRDLILRGADFAYQQGPDGRRYAVSGEVVIDTSPVQGDPEATENKAYHIRETALAPTKPSNQDRAVASMASRMAQEARLDIQRRQRAEAEQAYRQTAAPSTTGGAVINQNA